MSPINHLAKLYEIAEGQAGYFTTAQAVATGVDRRRLSYFASVGRAQRVRPGIYRLTQFPHSRYEDLVTAWLTAGPGSVISHESALLLYELSDVLPETIHVTVSPTTSRRHPGLRLHTNQIGPADITRHEGLPVTTVPRTIADVALAGLSDEFVIQAAREAVRTGLATPVELLVEATQRSMRLVQLLQRALAEVDQP